MQSALGTGSWRVIRSARGALCRVRLGKLLALKSIETMCCSKKAESLGGRRRRTTISAVWFANLNNISI